MTTLINLLPDFRQEKARNNRHRRMAKVGALGVIGISLGLVVILFLISMGQKIRINILSGQIESNQAKINSIPNLAQVLTVQQHLDSLNELYGQRVLMTKMYQILSGLQPKEVALESLALSDQNILTLSAKARNFISVTRFIKALEASNTGAGDNAGLHKQPYFSNVTVTSVTADNSNAVTFSVSATLSPEVTHAQ